MGNLQSDAKAGLIDAVIMLGDHSYNWDMGDERRGDGCEFDRASLFASCIQNKSIQTVRSTIFLTLASLPADMDAFEPVLSRVPWLPVIGK
jgi:hypothetical protein